MNTSMGTDMHCRELPPQERPAISEFYALTGYTRTISNDERVFVVEKNHAVLAAARIENRDDVNVLRGVYVHPAHKREGLGSTLLAYMSGEFNGLPGYCISYAHLNSFYGQIGFTPVSETLAPAFLQTRFRQYDAEGDPVAMLYRSP